MLLYEYFFYYSRSKEKTRAGKLGCLLGWTKIIFNQCIFGTYYFKKIIKFKSQLSKKSLIQKVSTSYLEPNTKLVNT